jgi:NAD(P)-dependent dehydrogenase (short-subunit alcohol dehydrogenase family)
VADQAWREGEAPVGGPGGSLTGRVAIVTGAAGGLGRTTVQALRDAGATVVPVDVHGDDCLIADVATAEGNRAMVDLALERHDRLDVLVLNAGATRPAGRRRSQMPEQDRAEAIRRLVSGLAQGDVALIGSTTAGRCAGR